MIESDYSNSRRITELDGIRGIAVSLVLIWHFVPCQLDSGIGLWVSALRRALYLTGSGVDLFFVLSGFLIIGILLDQREATNYLRVFYLRRACRILPLYFLVFGLFVCLAATVDLAGPARQWLFGNALPLWSYASFTQNILMGIQGHFGAGGLAVTWSLAVEEQFYLVIPLLVLVTGRRKLVWLLPALFVVIPFLRMASPGFYAYVNTPWRADPLIAGGCVALLIRSERWVQTIRANSAWLRVLGLIMLVIVPFMIMWPGCLGVFDKTWLAISYSLLVAAAVMGTHPRVARLLRNKTLVWLGTYSYGIYMLHQLASGLLHGVIKKQAPIIAGVDDAGITLLALLVTLMAAWISFKFFESPATRYGHRFRFQTIRCNDSP